MKKKLTLLNEAVSKSVKAMLPEGTGFVVVFFEREKDGDVSVQTDCVPEDVAGLLVDVAEFMRAGSEQPQEEAAEGVN